MHRAQIDRMRLICGKVARLCRDRFRRKSPWTDFFGIRKEIAMNRIDRRDFLKSCCVAAVAGGVGSRAKAYFAPPPLIPATATQDTLVIVFLRGAMDGLSLLPPGGSSPFRADYEANRTNTRVPTSGVGAALPARVAAQQPLRKSRRSSCGRFIAASSTRRCGADASPLPHR